VAYSTINNGDSGATIRGQLNTMLAELYGGGVASAPKLATPRHIILTGDVSYDSGGFDGSADVSQAAVLAAVNSNVGTFGDATNSPRFTVDGKGRVTAVSNVPIAGASPIFPGYLSGNWYLPLQGATLANGTAGLNATLQLMPVLIEAAMTIAGIGARVSTVSSGGNAMVALYANNPATMRPTGTPLASAIGLSTAVATTLTSTFTGPSISPGIYWAAGEFDNATAAFLSVAFTSALAVSLVGSATPANALSGGGGGAPFVLSVTNTYGSFPNLTSATFTEMANTSNRPPAIILKAA
jgi:hypothetical protein